MRALSAEWLLGLPVRLHGIRLGHPVDVLLDRADWRALGFAVRCGDDANRFLAWATVTVGDDELMVASAFMLLEDIDFYRSRSRSLRSLRGAETPFGPVGDLLLAEDGTVIAVVAGDRRVPPDEVRFASTPEPSASGW
jgi:hypothetical protein